MGTWELRNGAKQYASFKSTSFAMLLNAFKSFVTIIAVLIAGTHISSVVLGFEKIVPKVEHHQPNKKSVNIQTEKIDTQSKSVEACNCGLSY